MTKNNNHRFKVVKDHRMNLAPGTTVYGASIGGRRVLVWHDQNRDIHRNGRTIRKASIGLWNYSVYGLMSGTAATYRHAVDSALHQLISAKIGVRDDVVAELAIGGAERKRAEDILAILLADGYIHYPVDLREDHRAHAAQDEAIQGDPRNPAYAKLTPDVARVVLTAIRDTGNHLWAAKVKSLCQDIIRGTSIRRHLPDVAKDVNIHAFLKKVNAEGGNIPEEAAAAMISAFREVLEWKARFLNRVEEAALRAEIDALPDFEAPEAAVDVAALMDNPGAAPAPIIGHEAPEL